MKKQNPSAFRFLLLQLSEYGLNPKDWHIQKNANQIIELAHRKDPELKIRGSIMKLQRGYVWNSLSFLAF
jgi:hypothetical protein